MILDPGPHPNIGHAVLPFTFTRQILPRLARELPTESDLHNSKNTKCLVVEALDGEVGLFLLTSEVVQVALVWGAGSVPEEQPLEAFVALELIFEAELVVLVGELEEVEEFGGGLHAGEGWGGGVVDYNWDSTCRATVSHCRDVWLGERIIPFGLSRRNHSSFWTLVEISINWVVNSVP